MCLFSKDQDLICPGCGNRIHSSDRFCKYCGRAVVQASSVPPAIANQKTRLCIGCGREVPEGLNFCPFCGKPTAGSAPTDTALVTQSAPAAPSESTPVPMPAVTPPTASPTPALKPMTKCIGCGREIPEGLKFCPYCARPNPSVPAEPTLAPAAPELMPEPIQAPPAVAPSSLPPASSGMERCKACGKEIPSGLKYCPYCGRLATQPTAPAPAPVYQPSPTPAPVAPVPVPQPAPVPQPIVAPQATTKRCVGCGREISMGMKFCPYCGTPDRAPLQPETAPPVGTRICPGCGKEVSITHDFCPSCGYPKNPRLY